MSGPAAEFPSRPRFRHGLATSYNSLGLLFKATGRPKEAETAYTDALALLKQLVADFSSRPEYRRLLLRKPGDTLQRVPGLQGGERAAHLAGLPATVRVGLFVTSPGDLTVSEGASRFTQATASLRPCHSAGQCHRHVEPRRNRGARRKD